MLTLMLELGAMAVLHGHSYQYSPYVGGLIHMRKNRKTLLDIISFSAAGPLFDIGIVAQNRISEYISD